MRTPALSDGTGQHGQSVLIVHLISPRAARARRSPPAGSSARGGHRTGIAGGERRAAAIAGSDLRVAPSMTSGQTTRPRLVPSRPPGAWRRDPGCGAGRGSGSASTRVLGWRRRHPTPMTSGLASLRGRPLPSRACWSVLHAQAGDVGWCGAVPCGGGLRPYPHRHTRGHTLRGQLRKGRCANQTTHASVSGALGIELQLVIAPCGYTKHGRSHDDRCVSIPKAAAAGPRQ